MGPMPCHSRSTRTPLWSPRATLRAPAKRRVARGHPPSTARSLGFAGREHGALRGPQISATPSPNPRDRRRWLGSLPPLLQLMPPSRTARIGAGPKRAREARRGEGPSGCPLDVAPTLTWRLCPPFWVPARHSGERAGGEHRQDCSAPGTRGACGRAGV
jgi:hypothetical protein